ncbi:MAG TPA: glycoside hydrolase family 99-like domain-containing protein [Rhodopila sp.]|uniref:glycoside hydrolase family 99-like domain-containing protein n=1 Tax=Rhodopila sp. TaxID=2480087 RepID=UPI002C1A720D|nr:glycoside hydrolase family 99-like domain-containing protein [Rhodopila sp.]HVY14943.1 glycoside hydrolase family 99-like domain-containing protein [Rhodopila sp.]
MDNVSLLTPPVLSGRRILVGLIEHFGDIVACEPVARYLRFNAPDAHIAWVVMPAYRELIDTNPYIDETITVDCLTDWIRLTSHTTYDQLVDLHVNYRVCPHCYVPLVKRGGKPFVTAFNWFDYGPLLEAFSVGAGLPRLSAQPRIYLGTEHREAVDALGLPARFCVVHRKSNDPLKDWTAEGWEWLAKIIREELGLTIVEVGAGAPEDMLPPIRDSIDLTNRLPLLQTAEVIRRAGLFIGIDSGPAHFANALQVPGVVLLGRLIHFRQYCPYTGFYAGSSPQVKLVRNLNGPAAELGRNEVAEAVRYVLAAAEGRVPAPSKARPQGWLPPRETQSQKILLSGQLDVGFYVLSHPELEAEPQHPVDHWVQQGMPRDEGVRDMPGSFPAADAAWKTSPVENGSKTLDALLRPEDQRIFEAARIAPQATGQFAGERGMGESTVVPPRLLAFYLPQFHPIPENNWAHGMGFTEWNNVIKAKPLFRTHYQPRIPGELGFYDLRAEEVLHQQISLAQQHGIDGFCFYYYYFQGRKLLYRPIENFVKSGIDAPFLCLWANENWTRRWDGGDREVIVAQQHSYEDDLLALRELVPLFQDRRYVTIRGRPVMMVYKPHLFPDIRRTVDTWRTEIGRHGFTDLFLVTVDDWPESPYRPGDIGFDASYEIPSNLVPSSSFVDDTSDLDLVPDFAGRIVDYAKFARFHMGRPAPAHRRFRTVMAPWDNTARYGTQAMVQINGGGDAYKLWLMRALLDACLNHAPEERLVFLHSWNEWCEGTYIEPDGKLGRFYLEQTRDAVALVREALGLANGRNTMEAVSSLLLCQLEKDRGALQVVEALRLQAAHQAIQARNEVGAELDELRRRLDAMRDSTSWRITRPLRTLATLVRGR